MVKHSSGIYIVSLRSKSRQVKKRLLALYNPEKRREHTKADLEAEGTGKIGNVIKLLAITAGMAVTICIGMSILDRIVFGLSH
jgi:hypothetical protein